MKNSNKKSRIFNKKTTKKPLNINFLWERKKKPSLGADIFVNVKFVTFIILSLVSAFINLIFIAGLTKSPYILGDTRGWYLSIPAALFLGCLSIALDISKALHVIQVNTLNNLARRLEDKPWVGKIQKVARKWLAVYILYVILSVITSVSLSSISIGSGITRNANLRDQVAEYISEGELYSGINKEAKNVNIKNLVTKATDTSEQEAITFAKQRMLEIRPEVEAYKEERDEFEAQFNGSIDWSSEWKGEIADNYWEKRNRRINTLLQNAGYGSVTGPQIKNLNLSNVELVIKNNYLASSKTTSTDEATAKLNQLTDETDIEALAWLQTLNNLQLLNPKTNEIVVFDTSEDKPASVLAKTAVTQLKALKVDIENDSGDIGISSKIFMQLGGWITSLKKTDAAEGLEGVLVNSTKSSTFGPTEIMMMLMLLFLSLLCELGINQFSPEVSISRKMLAQFRRYYAKDFDVNKFVLELSVELRDYELIDDEDLAAEVKYVKDRILKKNELKDLLNGVVVQEEEKPENLNIKKNLKDGFPKPTDEVKIPSVNLTTALPNKGVIQESVKEISSDELYQEKETEAEKQGMVKDLKEEPLSKNKEVEFQKKETTNIVPDQIKKESILKYKPGTIGYSENVDNAIEEIDALLSEEE